VLRWFKGASVVETIPQAYFEPLPWPWQHRDIGDSPRFGNASYADDDASAQTFTVSSGGFGIDPATGRDDGHYVWQTSATDFDVVARVSGLDGPAGMGAGLSARRSTADNAAMLSLVVVSTGPAAGDRALALSWRAADGAAPSYRFEPLPETPAELRLTRRGTNIWAYYRTAGSGGWVTVTNAATQLSGTICAGMTVFSGDTELVGTGVFDTVSFVYPQNNAFFATVANHAATVSVSNKPPMQVRQENDQLPNVRYYWSDALSGNVGSYTVNRSDRPDQNFSAIGQAAQVGGGFEYTDPLPATNTLVFYRLTTAYELGPLAAGGSNDLVISTGVYGVSDGRVTGAGTGLFAAVHRAPLPDNYYTNRPVHSMVRDLSGWEKGTAPNDTNPMVTAASSDDGVQIGPDNFQMTWAGWLLPQYTGYHWFRTQTDDANDVWVAGKKVVGYWGYTAAAQTSAAVWLEAGKRVPIHVYFQQGTGGGYFRMWWMNGYGLDAGYVTIPSAHLYPMAPDGTPFTVAPGSANEFGPWRNIDISTGKPGYAALGGTPEAFSCTLSGGGSDIWGTADQFHFVYQEMAENFEVEATFNSLLPTDPWAKVGLMVRDGTSAGARNVCLIQSASNGRHLQYRSANGASAGNADGYAAGLAILNPISGLANNSTPVTFKMVRERGKIRCYMNGQHVEYSAGVDIDVSGWSKTLCVGLAITSHNNSRLTYALATDVTFTVIHPKGTVILMK
jgi:hypothetical protein